MRRRRKFLLAQASALSNLKAQFSASSFATAAAAIYLHAQPLQANAIQNWANPGTNDLVSSGTMTFIPNVGFMGDGSTASLLGGTFTSMALSVNNMSAGFFSLSTTQSTSIGIVATDTASQPFGFQSADASRSAGIRSGSTTTDLLPGMNSGICHIAFSRTVSGSYSAYIDQMKSTVATASTNLPTAAKYTEFKAGTGFVGGIIAASWIFKRALTDAEYKAWDNMLTTYLQSIGAYTARRGIDGAWTWFNDPRVITVNGEPIVGSITSNGTPTITHLNNTSGLVERGILHNILLGDDHCNPGLWQPAGTGKIIAAYNKHNDPSMFSRISVNANDITSFAAEIDLASQLGTNGASNYAYANFVELPGESNKLYLFFRATTALIWTLHYSTSTDSGATWAGATRLLWDGRPYWKSRANGTSRIDLIVNDENPGDATYPYNNTYHFYYQGGHFFTSAGVDMGSPPFTQLQPTLIWDSIGTGIESWVWDLRIDTNGHPVAVFATFPDTDHHQYYQARWDGTKWNVNHITAAGGMIYAGQPQYSGGIVTDPLDMNTVYCSIKLDPTGAPSPTGIFQLFKYQTADNGLTWTGTQLTFGGQHALRPFIADGTRAVYYMVGRYTAYTDYALTIEHINI